MATSARGATQGSHRRAAGRAGIGRVSGRPTGKAPSSGRGSGSGSRPPGQVRRADVRPTVARTGAAARVPPARVPPTRLAPTRSAPAWGQITRRSATGPMPYRGPRRESDRSNDQRRTGSVPGSGVPLRHVRGSHMTARPTDRPPGQRPSGPTGPRTYELWVTSAGGNRQPGDRPPGDRRSTPTGRRGARQAGERTAGIPDRRNKVTTA